MHQTAYKFIKKFLYVDLICFTCNLPFIIILIFSFLDVNDNPPEFASKYYFAKVTEGMEVGTEVVRVLATSVDTGVNAEITYAIVGGNQHRKFSIDPTTGLVSLAADIDHEVAREYFLTIQAVDGGIPPLHNHATVNITVLDANDNAPIFTQAAYSAVINENSAVGHKIISLTATDIDQVSPPQNVTLWYPKTLYNAYNRYKIQLFSISVKCIYVCNIYVHLYRVPRK